MKYPYQPYSISVEVDESMVSDEEIAAIVKGCSWCTVGVPEDRYERIMVLAGKAQSTPTQEAK